VGERNENIFDEVVEQRYIIMRFMNNTDGSFGWPRTRPRLEFARFC